MADHVRGLMEERAKRIQLPAEVNREKVMAKEQWIKIECEIILLHCRRSHSV